MRSRPRVKLTLAPSVIHPGTELVAELLVESGSETPCDFVDIQLLGYEQMFTGSGNGRRSTEHVLTSLRVRHEPKLLAPGPRTFAGRFPIPAAAPAAFTGAECSVQYVCKIHISIPWWPDRRESYVVPVRWAPRPVFEAVPRVFATNTAGPTGGAPYMEASLDRTEIVAGEAVSGRLSVANVAGNKIRSVRASILGVEHRFASFTSDQLATQLGAQIHAGAVAEGQAIPFKLVFPGHLAPSFRASLFRIDYQLELRADVAWGSDVVLRVPIVVHPMSSAGGKSGGVAPVGRERRAVIWADVAQRLGLVNDPEQERMLFDVGGVSLVVQLETRGVDSYVTGVLSWAPLGLDLTLGKHEWTSLFGDHVDVLHAEASRRFTIHAREHAQARELFDPALLDLLVRAGDVHVDDAGARLAMKGNAQVADRLARIVDLYREIARAFSAAFPRVPAPALMAEPVPAWEAFAARVHGKLERGRMWIRGTWGTDVVEVGTLWGAKGELAGTRVAVVLEPPMEIDRDAPTTSAAARAELVALEALAPAATLHVSPRALAVLLREATADPQTLEPWLERLCRTARVLRGQTASGPFR